MDRVFGASVAWACLNAIRRQTRARFWQTQKYLAFQRLGTAVQSNNRKAFQYYAAGHKKKGQPPATQVRAQENKQNTKEGNQAQSNTHR